MHLLSNVKGDLIETSFQKLSTVLCKTVFIFILPSARFKYEERKAWLSIMGTVYNTLEQVVLIRNKFIEKGNRHAKE